jgi:16S rRNA C1402 (ribose-2'-O) methylase RsmI
MMAENRHIMTQPNSTPQTMEEIQLQTRIAIAKNLTKVWSQVKATTAKAAKKDAYDKDEKKALIALFKSFDEGLTPKLKAVEKAKDGPGYAKAVKEALLVVKSYKAKVTADEALSAKHNIALKGILKGIQEVLEGKKTTVEQSVIAKLDA